MNNQLRNTRTDHGREGLPFPAGAMKKQSAKSPQAAKRCKECGSPLSDTNLFCWMCGASPDCENDPRVDPSPIRRALTEHDGVISKPSAWQCPNEPAITEGEADAEPYSPEMKEAHFQCQEKKTEFATEAATGHPEPEHPVRSRWSIAIVLLLLLALAFLGYWQRDNAKALFGTTAEAAQH